MVVDKTRVRLAVSVAVWKKLLFAGDFCLFWGLLSTPLPLWRCH
jgi:hypothetical protein